MTAETTGLTQTKTHGLRLKRGLDFIIALIGLVLLSPLLLVVGVAVKVNSPGPVIFCAKRIGKQGRLFTLYKFRSMVTGAEGILKDLEDRNAGGPFMIKIADDPRVTWAGKFLRKYSLDELPQLWNVLMGEMSLVGPRPQAPNEVALYSPRQYRRLEVTPGITGLWQVTARDDPNFDVWVARDLEYIDNWSLWLDFKILLKTVKVVLTGKDSTPKVSPPIIGRQ